MISLNHSGELVTNVLGATLDVYINGLATPFKLLSAGARPISVTPVTTAISLIATREANRGLFSVLVDSTVVHSGAEYYPGSEGELVAVFVVTNFPLSTMNITFRNEGPSDFSTFAFNYVVYTQNGSEFFNLLFSSPL
jgi:hypothetical protein